MRFQDSVKRTYQTAILLFTLIFSSAIFAQETNSIQEPEIEYVKNWLYDYKSGPELRLNYREFSKQDAIDAEMKFKEIKAELLENKDDWFGGYTPIPESELGGVHLMLAPRAGFISYYVYTCMVELRSLNFGEIVDEPSAVWIKPVYSLNSRRRVENPTKYIKVKWGSRRLLILEEYLAKYLDRITGFYVEPETEDEKKSEEWFTVWSNTSDPDKPLSGLPVLPREYQHLLRSPINAKIISVGKRTIKKFEETSEEDEYAPARNESQTVVKINIGSPNGVKIGMKFRILKTNESLKIINVNRTESIGIIVRELDEKGQETYFDFETNKLQKYPKATVGWTITSAPHPTSFQCDMC